MEAQTARGVEYDTPEPREEAPAHVAALRAASSSRAWARRMPTALAAEQRGFYLRTRSSAYKRYPLRALDFAALAVCVALVALGVVF